LSADDIDKYVAEFQHSPFQVTTVGAE